MSGVSRRLAEFVARSRREDIPQNVLHECRRSFVNWMGCTLGGCRHEAVEKTLPVVAAIFPGQQASLIGRRERASMAGAVYINVVANNAHFFNDTHLATVAHPAAPVVAVLLALAEASPMSGRDFLHAMVLGIEVQCRAGNTLVANGAHSHPGLYMAGLVGPLGAAVAASRAMNLDEDKTLAAIGISISQAGGLRESFGTLASHIVLGQSATSGLMAALFAAQGTGGPAAGLEGKNGFGSVFATDADANAAGAGLGVEFETLLNSYKPYPCGILVHPIIDVCLDFVRAHAIAHTDIERVELHVNPAALVLTGRRAPKNAMEGGTSLYHWAAAALVSGKGGLEQRSDASVLDEKIVALSNRIVAAADESLPVDAARGCFVLKDGRNYNSPVTIARGSNGRPMSDADLGDKFMGQAEMILGEAPARALLERCWAIETSDNVADFLALGRLNGGESGPSH
jgi:2-methylcitrate dehydratase PrpD